MIPSPIASSQADGHASLADRVAIEIAAVLDLMVYDVRPESFLRENYRVTDADYQQLRVAIERAFGIFVPIAHVQHWKTVGDITRYVETRLAR